MTNVVQILEEYRDDVHKTPLDRARDVFQKWMHLPNPWALYVTLAAIAANRLDGDPLWLLLIGPPGDGKTELLMSVHGLEDTHLVGTLTEAALLSGTAGKEKAKDAHGGLLREIGDNGIVICKDFTTVLAMNADGRQRLLAALREVYDGNWTRNVGTDGGRTLAWQGRIGLVGGCTPTIDRHHGVMSAMGERLALYRLPEVDADTQSLRALSHDGNEERMRQELAAAAREVLDSAAKPRGRTDVETQLLVTISTLVVRARSAVERDGYTREIELVSRPESPTRLAKMLARLLNGLDAIGCDREEALRIVTKTGLDSVPALRLAALTTLHAEDNLNTNNIADAVRHPSTTTRRALEDLHAHGLVNKHRGEQEKDPHHWTLTDFARERLGAIPEISPPTEMETNRDFGKTEEASIHAGSRPTPSTESRPA